MLKIWIEIWLLSGLIVSSDPNLSDKILITANNNPRLSIILFYLTLL